MDNKLYIIGDSADKDNILALCSQLSNKGVEAGAIFPAEERSDSEKACSVLQALLWISSKAGSQLFNIAQERNKRNLTTYNLFIESVNLYDSERSAIGRNQSIFAEVNPDEFVEDLIELVGKNKQSSLHQIPKNKISQPKNQDVSTFKAPGKTSVVKEEQAVSTSNPNYGSAEVQSNSVSEAEVESNEAEEGDQTVDKKRLIWRPCVWYLMTILYNICIFSRILRATTDQTVWYLVLNAVYFILAYKIIRSTISAIKINKWCYAYVPISLCGVIWSLDVGFRCLGIFINDL